MIDNLSFRSFRLNSPILDEHHHRDIEQVYALYRRVYDEEYDIMYGEGAGAATSENFYLNDVVDVIFSDEIPIAFVLYRYANLALTAHYHQKWLEEWPRDVLDQLKQNSPELLLFNHLTVAPDYRRSTFKGLNIGALLMGVTAVHFIESGEALGLGAMRVNRSTQSLSSMVGARCLKKSHVVRSLEVELVGFYRDDIIKFVTKLPDFIRNIVIEGTYYGSRSITKAISSADVRKQGGGEGISLA